MRDQKAEGSMMLVVYYCAANEASKPQDLPQPSEVAFQDRWGYYGRFGGRPDHHGTEYGGKDMNNA